MHWAVDAYEATRDRAMDEATSCAVPAGWPLVMPRLARDQVINVRGALHATIKEHVNDPAFAELTLGMFDTLDEDYDFTVRAMPLHLSGAMWLQLADAVEREAQYGRCTVCTHDFEVTDGRSRRRLYCSPACKQRQWRKDHPDDPAT